MKRKYLSPKEVEAVYVTNPGTIANWRLYGIEIRRNLNTYTFVYLLDYLIILGLYLFDVRMNNR